MKLHANKWFAVLCLAVLFLLALCDTTAAKPPARGLLIRSGPPAHAPANGYRRKQVCGFELIFDVGVGMYVAVGMTDVYYHEGHFYRCRGGVWEISLRGTIWEVTVIDKLPPGLQVKAKSMIKVNGNGNSLVKLNGNNNGPNGNAAAGGVKPDNVANAGGNKSADAGTVKAGGPANAVTGKPAGSATVEAGKANSGGTGALGKTGTNTGAAVSKPVVKPSVAPKPAVTGRKK
jgi:hypothetical protein